MAAWAWLVSSSSEEDEEPSDAGEGGRKCFFVRAMTLM